MRPALIGSILAMALPLAGCDPSPVDLGFKDKAEMQAAFKMGYKTRARMEQSQAAEPLPDYTAPGLTPSVPTVVYGAEKLRAMIWAAGSQPAKNP